MRAVQGALETKLEAWKAAAAASMQARIRRDEDQRVFVAKLRDFAFILLSGNGNHHDADPYLIYFPDGYGHLQHVPAAQVQAFGEELLSKLAQESDAQLLASREELEAALNQFASSMQVCKEAKAARDLASALVQAEKRNWARGVFKSQALAKAVCHFEAAYVRAVFAGVASPRTAVKESPGVVETPSGTALAVVPPDDPAIVPAVVPSVVPATDEAA